MTEGEVGAKVIPEWRNNKVVSNKNTNFVDYRQAIFFSSTQGNATWAGYADLINPSELNPAGALKTKI